MVSIVFRLAALFFMAALIFPIPPQPGGHRPSRDPGETGPGHKIYVAFGFHANLYHSYRLDTNTEAGFGKDIRVMRSIVNTLDAFNRRGVGVKGVWDMDNLFTLEDVLPRHAPDIIDNIKRRLEKNGDEMIVMSYNNALASAQTPEELRASIERAITNRNRSGLQDVFHRCSPIVRPQEMMVTPGDFHFYKEMGIKALTLYYSAITFDAFRMFVRPLSYEEAFNPLTYKNKDTGEAMTVVPAYTIGDLLENVSLGHLVGKLRERQVSGEIDRDLIVFINFDADDSYWEGYDLPWHLSWLPNTGGLKALIEEVADLDYVSFTTLSEYLADHGPVGEVSFGQDTADGNFNGYNSWAEKATSGQYWTKVVENRRRHTAIEKIIASADPDAVPDGLQSDLTDSFDLRLRLLSTTNYGMAAPFVTPERERVVESVIRRSEAVSGRAMARAKTLAWKKSASRLPAGLPVAESKYIDTLTILGGQKEDRHIAGGMIRIAFSGSDIGPDREFFLVSGSGEIVPLRRAHAFSDPDGVTRRVSLFIPSSVKAREGIYHLYAAPGDSLPKPPCKVLPAASKKGLKNEYFEISLSDAGVIAGVYYQGDRVLNEAGLVPGVVYGPEGKRKRFGPTRVSVTVESSGSNGVACLRLQGEIPLSGNRFLESGRFDYRFTLMAGEPFLFIEGGIQYPETRREDLLSSGYAALVKKYDPWWYEAAPLELDLTLRADRQHPFKVLKRNFLGMETSYDIDYFKHSEKNLDLANVNNHVTSEYVGISGKGRGVALAMDNSVYSNFAFCPLKLAYDRNKTFDIKMNPFGTYFGRQYVPPTWGNRQGYQAALLAGKQYCSSAPSYNGAYHPFSVALACFDGDRIPADMDRSLIRFAHPPVVIPGRRTQTWTPELRPATGPRPPRGLVSASGNDGVYFHWEASRDRTRDYKIYYGRQPGQYDREYITGSNSVRIEDLDIGRRYYATVAGMDEKGEEGPAADEISFLAGKPVPEMEIDLPVSFQVRVMLTSLFR